MPEFSREFCGLVAPKLNYSCIVACCVITVYTNCTFSCLLVIGASVSELPSSDANGDFLLYYIWKLLVVVLDTNIKSVNKVHKRSDETLVMLPLI